MKIRKLSEEFKTLRPLMNDKKLNVHACINDVPFANAIAEESIFDEHDKEVEEELKLRAEGAEASTKDDKEATGKDRYYDQEHPAEIADNEYTNPEKFMPKEEKKTLGESAKLRLDESTASSVIKPLTEDMGAATLSDGREIMASGWTTSTRTYVTEHCTVEVGYREAEGKYKWMNRPWQRFRYESAFRDAMVQLGFDKADIDNATRDAYDLREAVKNFAKIYNDRHSDKEGPIEESIGGHVGKYQKWVDYDMKRYGKISDRTMDTLRKAELTVVKSQYGDWEVIPKEDENLKEDFSTFNDRFKLLPKEKQEVVIEMNKKEETPDWDYDDDEEYAEYEKVYKDEIDRMHKERYGFTW